MPIRRIVDLSMPLVDATGLELRTAIGGDAMAPHAGGLGSGTIDGAPARAVAIEGLA
jgi:hypothetical protein